jgi:hypothetical protein
MLMHGSWFSFGFARPNDNGSNLRALVSSCEHLGPALHSHTMVMARVQK